MTKPALLLALAFAAAPAAAAPADDPAKLVDAYFKAKKPEERAKCLAAIDAAAPLGAGDVAALREQILDALAKRGRKVGSGREEWFDEKRDGWKGLYVTSGKGSKGLVLGLHGGGAGSGDCGQAESSFSGPVGSLGYRGVYPEVLVKTEYGWTDPPETEKWVLELVRAARRTWGTDPNRVYVTGHSMGGYGTWTYGAIHADLFAAGAAFAGAPTVYWRTGKKDKEAEGVLDGILPNLRNLPLFVYQSLDDPQVPAAANVFAAAALKSLHESDAKGWEHVYEQVDGRKHDFPEKGPLPGMQWMASHVRDPRPPKVLWQPSRDWKTSFYWVRWTKPWVGATLTATVDRAKNSIDATVALPRSGNPAAAEAERASRVDALSFWIDEKLVDPSKEVVVTVDGKERWRGLPTASLGTLLRSAEEREDPEYAFAYEGPPAAR